MIPDLHSRILDVGPGWLGFDKPAGLSAHNASSPDEPDLLSILARLVQDDSNLQKRLQTPSSFKVHLVHRLDQATSGVCLVAFDAKTAARLAQAFEHRQTVKDYVAVVKGTVEGSGRWEWELTNKAEGRKAPQGSGERKQAVTLFQVLATTRYFSSLQIRLETGRQHQIRRHAALAKHPVIGDTRYGDPAYQKKIAQWYGFDRLALHAKALEVKGETIRLEAPVPTEFAKLLATERTK